MSLLQLQFRDVSRASVGFLFALSLTSALAPALLAQQPGTAIIFYAQPRVSDELWPDLLASLQAARDQDPRASFVIRSLLIHEYRRLHLRDPLLPARLLPAAWPGTQAATVCRDIYALVLSASELYLSSVAAQLDGPLPPPDGAMMQRFGGIKPPK